MKLTLVFKLDNDTLTNHYHDFLMSYFKHALSKEYKDDFEGLYMSGNKIKPFTFSTYIPQIQHQEGFIISPNKELKVFFSSSDYHFMMILYNALLLNKGYKMTVKPNNKIALTRLSLDYLPIIEKTSIHIKMMSPLLIRVHQEDTNKDNYLSVQDEDFIEQMQINLAYLCGQFSLSTEGLKIIPIKTKKVVVSIMNQKYDATLGEFVIEGTTETLNNLYKIGIGSRRSEGFGMFEVLNV